MCGADVALACSEPSSTSSRCECTFFRYGVLSRRRYPAEGRGPMLPYTAWAGMFAAIFGNPMLFFPMFGFPPQKASEDPAQDRESTVTPDAADSPPFPAPRPSLPGIRRHFRQSFHRLENVGAFRLSN